MTIQPNAIVIGVSLKNHTKMVMTTAVPAPIGLSLRKFCVVSWFERQLATLRNTRDQRAGLAAAFNGVFLEGLEVAIIVVTVGSASSAALAAAAAGALAAFALVVIAEVLVRQPFGRIPENAMKFVVGVMLVSLGTF